MRLLLLTLTLPILLSACSPPPATEPDLAYVLERHAGARGGSEAIEGIQSFAADLEITEPEFTVTARYIANRDGRMRIDVYSGDERVFTEALGPDGGWQMHADGVPIDLSLEGERALKRGIVNNLYGLHELAQLGFRQTLVGLAERSDGRFWEIEQVDPDGELGHIFIDAESFLISSNIATAALHPDIDSTETRQETFYRDYAATAGVLFSTRTEKLNIETGEVMQSDIVKALRINEPIDESLFFRPESDG